MRKLFLALWMLVVSGGAFAQDPPKGTPSELYNSVFRWRGAVTTRQAFTRLSAKSTPEARKTIEQLRDVIRQLNRLTQNPPEGVATKLIKVLDEQREMLEIKLVGQLKDDAPYKNHLKLTPADLQKSLPEGTALVDFLVQGDSISAFIITKTSIQRVVLKAGKELDEELAAFLGDLSLGRTRPVINKDDVSAKLRARIWEPLEEHLKGITRVLICPDGALCRLPFAALPGSDPKKYLLEELSLVIVPVPQLLPGLLNAEANKAAPQSLLAVGDVDFDGDPPPPGAGNRLNWKRLPHTKEEVEAIEALFVKQPGAKVKRLTGKETTEAALEAELPKHRYVHLATHGFFAPPKIVRQFKEGKAPVLPPELSSGIVCAGANNPTLHNSGILTALQIAELDLSAVELVVLSADETGLGELAGGEGVLGLQRAFQIAGARSTISSLFAIPDQATAELMKQMYANRLVKGLAWAEALREAQLWVLNNGEKVGAFDQKPTGSKRTPPKYWAAFTFAGDWR
jgi:CHAT domain-containing protein